VTVGQRTTFLKPTEVTGAGTAAPNWFVVDGDDQIVGRLATQIATVLMGKHKPTYTPHVDSGDCVVVVNAERVKFVGNEMTHPKHPHFSDKMSTKTYYTHSQFVGGLKATTAAKMWDKNPTEILRLAVRRMLPKNALARHMLDKLHLYVGSEHPHQAQQPQPFPEHLLPT